MGPGGRASFEPAVLPACPPETARVGEDGELGEIDSSYVPTHWALRCPTRGGSDATTIARELRLLAIDQDGELAWEAATRERALIGSRFEAPRIGVRWPEGWSARGFA